MKLSTTILKTLSLAVLIGFFCDSAFAIKILTPPLEQDELEGVWISPVGEFEQSRLTIAESGNGTFALSLYRGLEEDDIRLYSVSQIHLDDYSFSIFLQPLNGGSLISLTGYANQGEIKFSLPEEDDFLDTVTVRVVPEMVARKEIKDIERLQALLTAVSKRAEF